MAPLEKFQKRVRGRLKNWKEEEHRSDAELSQIIKRERIGFRGSGQGKAFLVRKPKGASGLKNLAEKHDEYLCGKKRFEKKRSKIAEQGRGMFKLKKHVENVDVEISKQSLKSGIREYRVIRRRSRILARRRPRITLHSRPTIKHQRDL